MALDDEIKAAIAAHGMWKVRLNEAIEKKTSTFTVDELKVDNKCAFGKWLYGASVPVTAKTSPGYAKCRDLHKQFHTDAASVLALAVGGKTEAAKAAMKPGSPFATSSAVLTKAMMDWAAASK